MSTSRASAESDNSHDSSQSETAPGPVSVPPKPAAETKRHIPIVSIPATISIGLLIAAVYLGGRILTAHRAHSEVYPEVHSEVGSKTAASAKPPIPPVAIQARAVVIMEHPKAPPEPVAQQDSATEEDPPRTTPRAGQRFIQVAAIPTDAEESRRFIRRLQDQKLDPHVAPGPSPELMRVLIGPFDSLDALKETKARLETEGIQTFVRLY
jgi:cell division septation protein DedD